MGQSSLAVKRTGTDLYVGPAGWSYDDWKGIVYPADAPPKFRGLRYLADHFNTVELNNTFYRPPNPNFCYGWLRDVQGRPDFSFTAKLWQRFTHEREEPWNDGDVRVFREGIGPIVEAGKLGALLAQFPWSFRYDDSSRDWVSAVVEEFSDMPLVLEVRSTGWTNDDAIEFIRKLGVSYCNIDQPALKGNIGLTTFGFGKVGYMRLHGRNAEKWFSHKEAHERYDYLYNRNELSEIRDAVEKIAQQVERMYVIANNHYRGQGPANALQLMSMLTEGEVSVPETLGKHYDIP